MARKEILDRIEKLPTPQAAISRERVELWVDSEMLASGIFQVPLAYAANVMEQWPNAELKTIIGMYMFGITQDDIATAIADNRAASPMDVIAARGRRRGSRHRWRHRRQLSQSPAFLRGRIRA